MPLADRQPPPSRSTGSPCSVGATLDKLPPSEADALAEMLAADSGWTQDAIYTALSEEGLTVGRQSIGRHRRGYCRCTR